MLYVATVHFRDPRWIEVQTRYLRRHISMPFEIWTSLEKIDASYGVHFDRVIDQAGGHAGKLNNLAVEISHVAEDDDLIMFIDGDAFPIADPMPLVNDALERAPLVAVRRAENLGDRQPHPCFCVTSVKTWRELPGDWSMGARWDTPDGRRPTDVGGNLLRTLELTGTPWVEILRSNRLHMDPLMFAVYGEAIYHHGAGFRKGGASREHYDTRPKPLPVAQIPLLRTLAGPIDKARINLWRFRTRRPQIAETRRMMERIEHDQPGWLAEIL